MVGEEAGDGEADEGGELAVPDHADAALAIAEGLDGQAHRGLAVAGHEEVVRVVADGGGDGAAAEAEVLEDAAGNVAVLTMALQAR